MNTDPYNLFMNGGKEQEAVRTRKVGRGDFELEVQRGPVLGNGH